MFDVEAIIEANGLEYTSNPVEQNPYMPQESSDLRHFLCTLSGGPLSGFEFYVSLGEDNTEVSPDVSFAISLLLEDVRCYRECDGYTDFARLIGVDDDDAAGEVAYHEIGRLAPLVDLLANMPQSPAPTLI